MENILVSHTLQEKDEATGNYISVDHKGYIQHWDCCPNYIEAIILSIEGKSHSVPMDKIWVEKEDMPKTKNNHGINRRNHKGVHTDRKGTNLDIYDRYSQGYNPLGSILKRSLPPPKQE